MPLRSVETSIGRTEDEGWPQSGERVLMKTTQQETVVNAYDLVQVRLGAPYGNT